MRGLLSVLLEMVAVSVVLIPVYFALNRKVFHSYKRLLWYGLFSYYLVALYLLVGMPNVMYIRFDLVINLIPFVGMVDDFKNSILNILLFVPLGFFLPVLSVRYRAITKTVFLGFVISAVIEILQIFTFRATDINDLITNTIGSFVGHLIYECIIRKYPKFMHVIGEGQNCKLGIACSITIVIMFFFHPLLSLLMWRFIP